MHEGADVSRAHKNWQHDSFCCQTVHAVQHQNFAISFMNESIVEIFFVYFWQSSLCPSK
jgi:hypothetical protein